MGGPPVCPNGPGQIPIGHCGSAGGHRRPRRACARPERGVGRRCPGEEAPHDPMKPGFEPGIEREITAVVTPDMCPAFDGVIIHRCYSTWSVVHHMEVAARKVIVDFLEADEEAVGAQVHCEHLAPCRVGRTVRVRAKLTEVVRKRVVTEVTAYDGDRLLARGAHTQVVFNKERLKRYIERS